MKMKTGRKNSTQLSRKFEVENCTFPTIALDMKF